MLAFAACCLLQDADYAHGEKARRQLHMNATSYIEKIQEKQNSSSTITYLLSLKPFNSDEQDMRDSTREVKANS